MIGIDAGIQIPTRCGECFACHGVSYDNLACFIKYEMVSGFDKPVWCPLCQLDGKDITIRETHTSFKHLTVWVKEGTSWDVSVKDAKSFCTFWSPLHEEDADD